MKRMVEDLEDNLERKTYLCEREILIVKDECKRKVDSSCAVVKGL